MRGPLLPSHNAVQWQYPGSGPRPALPSARARAWRASNSRKIEKTGRFALAASAAAGETATDGTIEEKPGTHKHARKWLKKPLMYSWPNGKQHSMKNRFKSALVHYQSTGIIPELLYKIFVHDGHYRGAEYYDGIDLDALDELKRTKLTPAQTVTRNKKGSLILQTSYDWDPEAPQTVPWHQIMGDAYFIDCPETNAPHLRSVGGILHITHGKVNMPFLTYAQKCFTWNLDELNLPSFATTGEMHSTAKQIILPRLTRMMGDFSASAATKLELHRLTRINGSFYAPMATHILAPNLRIVEGNLDTSSDPDFYHPDLYVKGSRAFHPEAEERWKRRDQARKAVKAICRNSPQLEI